MLYNIQPYSIKQAKALGVIIKPSKKKYKKVDVFDKSGNYLVSIGDNRYKDYPTYLAEGDTEYANERRRLYKIRHSGEGDENRKGTAGYFSYYILW